MSKKILIVEDDRFESKAIKAKFESSGFEVEIAYDGIEALELFQEGKFQAIVLDVLMPRMEGVEFFNTLKSRHKNIPKVIILTNMENFTPPSGISVVLNKSTTSLESVVRVVNDVLEKNG